METKLNRDVELFKLGNTSCIGNFSNGSIIGLDKEGLEFVDFVTNNGVCCGCTEKERMIIEALQEGEFFEECSQRERQLISAYVHVTNRCNLNCAGCYSYDRTRNCKDALSLEKMKDILNQLREAGVQMITISGGEPMIRTDIADIVRYARCECGFEKINLITNGTLMIRDRFLEVKEYIDDLAVSVDGYDEENPTFLRDEGIFQTIMTSVTAFKEMGFNVSILPTLHRQNINNMEKYFELSKRLGVGISFSLMTCPSDLVEYIPTEEQLYKLSKYFDGSNDTLSARVETMEDFNIVVRKSCGAGKNIISVGADGSVYPCHMMHQAEVVIGDLRGSSLAEILDRSEPMPPVEVVNNCSECEYRNLCGGGCKARALLVNDSLRECDPYCEMFRQFYQDFVERLNAEQWIGCE